METTKSELAPNHMMDGGFVSDGAATAAADTLGNAGASDAAATSSPSIPGLRLLGTACTEANTRVDVSPDGDDFTVTFDGFSAELSPGNQRAFADSQCSILLPLAAQRQTYALMTSTIEGTAALPSHMSVDLVTTPMITGFGGLAEATELEGPHSGAFSTTHTFAISERSFLPCPPESPRAYLIRTSIVLGDLGSAAARTDVGRVDVGRVRMNFSVRDCSTPSQSSRGAAE